MTDLETQPQRLAYLDDTYLTTLSTTVSSVDSPDELVLQDCIFHPQGGGQPADRGSVDGADAAPVRDHERGLVLLRVEGGTSRWSAGDHVETTIDRPLRLQHAALHSAGHLIESAGRSLGWDLASNNHFPGESRIEFTEGTTKAPATPEEREEVAERLREYVAQALAAQHPITAHTADDGLRIVSIGDIHSSPCGGTHVRTLADLDAVEIREVKVKKGRIKVAYDAAHRPLD